MTDNAMQIMWQEAQWIDMIIAFICGAVVGFIYLQSLRWNAIIVIIYLAAFLLTRFILLMAERKTFGPNR